MLSKIRAVRRKHRKQPPVLSEHNAVTGIHLRNCRVYPERMAAPTTPISGPATDKPPRPRRWVPLSLRVFVSMLLLLGVASAWLGVRGHEQLSVIREIERQGGTVESEPVGPKWLYELVGDENMRMFDEIVEVRLSVQATDATLCQMGRLTSLTLVTLVNSPATDVGLRHLKGMANLEWLLLSNTRVTDAGLANLEGLTNLKELWLSNTKVTDAGLVHLKGLTSLETLLLITTPVKDDGLANLKGLKNLKVLDIDDTQVTDAGLKYLKGMTNLRVLCLKYTQVTDAGVAELQRELPGLTIKR